MIYVDDGNFVTGLLFSPHAIKTKRLDTCNYGTTAMTMLTIITD